MLSKKKKGGGGSKRSGGGRRRSRRSTERMREPRGGIEQTREMGVPVEGPADEPVE